MRIPSGKIDQLIYFVAVDSVDLTTRKTGLSSFTVYRSRNGGTATVYTTPTVTELSSANMPGVYALTVDEDTTVASTSDSEEYCVHITQASMAPVTRTIELYRRDTTSGRTLVVDAAGLADANAVKVGPTGAGTAQTARDIGATLGVAGAGLTALGDTRIAHLDADISTRSTFAGGAVASVTGAVGSVTGLTASDVGAIKAKTDSLTFTVAGMIDSNVVDWNGSAAPAMTGDAFARLGAPAGVSVSADIADIKTDTADAKAVADRLNTTMADSGGSPTAFQFTTAALSNAPSGSGASAADIANAVWDEPTIDHQTAGTTGKAITDAQSAGDPMQGTAETGFTYGDVLRLLAAVAAGKDSIVSLGGSRAAVTFRSIDDSADRIVATMNGSNRESMTLTP